MMRVDFKLIVKQAWRYEPEGSNLFKLMKKLQLMKKMGKKWNKTTF